MMEQLARCSTRKTTDKRAGRGQRGAAGRAAAPPNPATKSGKRAADCDRTMTTGRALQAPFARPLLALCLLIQRLRRRLAAASERAGTADRNPQRHAAVQDRRPDATRIGHLIWRGGVAMTANSASFGGWSDLMSRRRQDADLDLRRWRMAHGDDRLRRQRATSSD